MSVSSRLAGTWAEQLLCGSQAAAQASCSVQHSGRELLLILTSHLLSENEGAGIWQGARCVFIPFGTDTNTFLAWEGCSAGFLLHVLSLVTKVLLLKKLAVPRCPGNTGLHHAESGLGSAACCRGAARASIILQGMGVPRLKASRWNLSRWNGKS